MKYLLLLALLLVSTALAVQSPLTNPEYTWDPGLDESTLGLPWYSVQPWEIAVCTQGLSTMYGYEEGENAVLTAELSTPFYRDTVTILAQRRIEQGITYYELGWYVQPFVGQATAELLLFNNFGENYSLSDEPHGYAAFPLSCDPQVYLGSCIPLRGELTHAQLRWRQVVGENLGPVQSLTTSFVLVNETY